MTKQPIDNPLQGEGDYQAARRYRKSVRDFVRSGSVETAAGSAAPDSPRDAEALKRAEQSGASHSKGEGSLVSSKNKTDE